MHQQFLLIWTDVWRLYSLWGFLDEVTYYLINNLLLHLLCIKYIYGLYLIWTLPLDPYLIWIGVYNLNLSLPIVVL